MPQREYLSGLYPSRYLIITSNILTLLKLIDQISFTWLDKVVLSVKVRGALRGTRLTLLDYSTLSRTFKASSLELNIFSLITMTYFTKLRRCSMPVKCAEKQIVMPLSWTRIIGEMCSLTQ